MSKKPEHHWETARGIAFRVAKGVDDGVDKARLHRDFAGDARAERFELRFHDGRIGHVTFGLEVQHACDLAFIDPGVSFAARAWLAARGQRRSDLRRVGDDGRVQAGVPRPFSVDDLSDAPLASPPQTLVTLCPSNVELVHALGCFDRVIACDVSSDYPEGVQALPRLGHDLAPDLQHIAQLAPDLVVSSLTVPGMERVVTGLRARGLRQLVLAPRSFACVKDSARSLAGALGVPERGVQLAMRLDAEYRQLQAERPAEPVRVYLEWWPRPMFSPGRDCYSNELIALAGGVNVFADRPGSSLQIEAEDLVRAEPDVCFVSWCGVRADKLDPEHLCSRAGLAELPAVLARRVYPLDEAFSGRPGPRMLEAARIMARAIRSAQLRAS